MQKHDTEIEQKAANSHTPTCRGVVIAAGHKVFLCKPQCLVLYALLSTDLLGDVILSLAHGEEAGCVQTSLDD